MSDVVKPFQTREQLKHRQSKEELKKFACQLIDEGDYVIVLGHLDEENVTDICMNLNADESRIAVKGILQDGLDIVAGRAR